jgi:laminin gamma 1
MKEANAQSILPSRKDIIIESASTNLEVYLPIYGGNHHLSGDNKPILPSAHSQKFQFKLNQNNGWLPTLTAFNFQRLLSNISSIKIRASYLPNTRTLLSKISLTSAKPYNQRLTSNISDLVTAKFVETCSCPTGYTGQHCQSCAYGYRRSPLYGGLFARCIPCTCNNHSNICDPDSGKCDCKHHTNGDNCEKCKKGYYGNALILTEKVNFRSF